MGLTAVVVIVHCDSWYPPVAAFRKAPTTARFSASEALLPTPVPLKYSPPAALAAAGSTRQTPVAAKATTQNNFLIGAPLALT
ncbi:hypothetical protein [Amycolatopsis xylanica]|uniref:hypothetical protein n=1 Tax=Amycolatopsis xylanica TaxID=589385 RepID=UPI000B8537AF|nr:hypothetical protein [Amycolatopsis xylanica]